jgi:hypothetical protein
MPRKGVEEDEYMGPVAGLERPALEERKWRRPEVVVQIRAKWRRPALDAAAGHGHRWPEVVVSGRGGVPAVGVYEEARRGCVR